eukprot:1160808-Pelagomonas_calceolata.AAC.35
MCQALLYSAHAQFTYMVAFKVVSTCLQPCQPDCTLRAKHLDGDIGICASSPGSGCVCVCVQCEGKPASLQEKALAASCLQREM